MNGKTRMIEFVRPTYIRGKVKKVGDILEVNNTLGAELIATGKAIASEGKKKAGAAAGAGKEG